MSSQTYPNTQTETDTDD
jgi:phosphatidate cytidylyltransferase